ncbi:hypothetical protein [Evansella cellulosilytica]|uniref:hypothetical protein n=1 Tax=Evansella cellulosilytica TaxID=1413 RepID=UPI00030D861C|nr:hypothetical protein [Evansella cellulosilytica]
MNNEMQTHNQQGFTSEHHEQGNQKKHSVLGIISFIIFGVMFLLAIVAVILVQSSINDYYTIADNTPYTFDELTEMMTLETAAPEYADLMDRADIRLGIAIMLAFGIAVGHVIGVVLGIIGVATAKGKKLFATLGLILNIVSPIVFFFIGLTLIMVPFI